MRVTPVWVIILITLYGCRGPNEPVPLWAPGLSRPFIPGIIWTDETGNDLGKIGDPQIPLDPTGLLELYGPYPNPTHYDIRVNFTLSRPAQVRSWVVRGIGFTENKRYSSYTQVGTHVVATPGEPAVFVLDDQDIPMGNNLLLIEINETWDDGYYRIYVQADDVLLWADFLFLTDVSCENLRKFGVASFFYWYRCG